MPTCRCTPPEGVRDLGYEDTLFGQVLDPASAGKSRIESQKGFRPKMAVVQVLLDPAAQAIVRNGDEAKNVAGVVVNNPTKDT